MIWFRSFISCYSTKFRIFSFEAACNTKYVFKTSILFVRILRDKDLNTKAYYTLSANFNQRYTCTNMPYKLVVIYVLNLL